MGISSTNPLLVSLNLKGRSVDGNNKEIISKALETQARRRWQMRVATKKRPSTRRSMLMKRRAARLDGLRRPRNGVRKRVRTLKKLIPNSSNEFNGLGGLFGETAAYILSLQMRVKVMQILVQTLSTTGSGDQ
ncbi:basic helix-loop-helix protein [Tripterygium wilfordii]|uniref:Basic helix-loop-helix protein n=1 Tax=Tripterygium wilfordii TaxID=458696 RepID=A0A7J7D599_TRIWF|nr:transcription factor UPBEAT1-like [Tripterygium wilfordii]KAF5741514.1 basic helix-loop-helix protein [Tripterygium wilfordii]